MRFLFIKDKMETYKGTYKEAVWWDSLSDNEKALFINYLYKNSELLGFYLDKKTNKYKYKSK